MSSSIYLTENFLKSEIGDAILLSDSGTIGTSQVGSNVSNPMLSLSNYRRTANNVLLNPKFDTGTLANWSSTGSPVVEVGNFPGVMYELNVGNLNSVSQQITGFQNLHPIFEIWHRGQEVILSLEIRDGSNVYLDGVNRTIPYNENWTQISIGMYNYFLSTTNSVKITIASVWDNSIVANCSMIGSDYYSSVNIGDEYNSDITDIVRVGARKLMIGPGLPSINSSILDIRGNQSLSGNLYVNGTVYSNIIFGPPGTLRFATNLIFSSGSTTLLNWTSGLIQTIDSVSYGINSGSAIISGLVYIYLDLNISSTTLQTSTTYTDVIGNQKIFLGTAQNQTTGNVSFTSQSGQTPIVSGQQLTPSSVTFDKITVNSLSALTGNMGTLIAGIINLSGAGSYLNFGVNAPVSSSGTIGLAGLYQDYTGLYSLSGTTLNASLTSSGLTVANGAIKLNSTGQSMNADIYPSSAYLKWVSSDDSTQVGTIVGAYGGALVNSGLLLSGKAKSGGTRGLVYLEGLTTSQNIGDGSSLVIDSAGIATFDLRTGSNTAINTQILSIKTKTSGTNNLNVVLSLDTETSGTVANGLGTAILYRMQNSANVVIGAGDTSIAWTDNTAGSEDSQFGIGLMAGGVLTTVLSLDVVNGLVLPYSAAIGTTSPANANSVLDLVSTTKAFLPPRMTTTQRDAISSPISGMIIYNSTTNKLNVRGASAWEAVTSV